MSFLFNLFGSQEVIDSETEETERTLQESDSDTKSEGGKGNNLEQLEAPFGKESVRTPKRRRTGTSNSKLNVVHNEIYQQPTKLSPFWASHEPQPYCAYESLQGDNVEHEMPRYIPCFDASSSRRYPYQQSVHRDIPRLNEVSRIQTVHPSPTRSLRDLHTQDNQPQSPSHMVSQQKWPILQHQGDSQLQQGNVRIQSCHQNIYQQHSPSSGGQSNKCKPKHPYRKSFGGSIKPEDSDQYSVFGSKHGSQASMDSEEDADDENICSFCKRGFVDGYSLIGPYSKVGSKKKHYVHDICVRWCPELKEFSDSLLFPPPRRFNVKLVKAISRSNSLKCAYCKEKGAAIGCNDRKCRHSYHLKCAHSDGAIFATVRHLLEETSTFLSLKRSINEKTILQSILLICIIFFYKSVMAQVRRALQTYCDVLPTIALLSGQWNSFSLAYKFLRPHLRSFFR